MFWLVVSPLDMNRFVYTFILTLQKRLIKNIFQLSFKLVIVLRITGSRFTVTQVAEKLLTSHYNSLRSIKALTTRTESIKAARRRIKTRRTRPPLYNPCKAVAAPFYCTFPCKVPGKAESWANIHLHKMLQYNVAFNSPPRGMLRFVWTDNTFLRELIDGDETAWVGSTEELQVKYTIIVWKEKSETTHKYYPTFVCCHPPRWGLKVTKHFLTVYIKLEMSSILFFFIVISSYSNKQNNESNLFVFYMLIVKYEIFDANLIYFYSTDHV